MHRYDNLCTVELTADTQSFKYFRLSYYTIPNILWIIVTTNYTASEKISYQMIVIL